MSEYQYYEFLAIDRPLTEEEMAALRSLSTRASITPVSFTNEYNWGDFKGSPDQLMRRFFDAHVYVANWMTATFMVRLPKEALTKETVKALQMPYILDFDAYKTHWVITWCLEESQDYERFGMEDGRGWMARLAPVRDELLRGDMRSLYIGWLAATSFEMPDDEMEPLAVGGLCSLTSAQQALAEFLEVDKDLLAGAGMGSPPIPNQDVSRDEMDGWIDALPKDEVKSVLRQLLNGDGQQAERKLKNLFEAWRRDAQKGRAEVALRTVGELRKNSEVAARIRREKQKRRRQQQETKRRKERILYLKNLSENLPKMWKEVQKTTERGSGRAYDEVCRLLVDLSEAYTLYASRENFQDEMQKFMAGHKHRKALIQHLVKAGIWKSK